LLIYITSNPLQVPPLWHSLQKGALVSKLYFFSGQSSHNSLFNSISPGGQPRKVSLPYFIALLFLKSMLFKTGYFPTNIIPPPISA